MSDSDIDIPLDAPESEPLELEEPVPLTEVDGGPDDAAEGSEEPEPHAPEGD